MKKQQQLNETYNRNSSKMVTSKPKWIIIWYNEKTVTKIVVFFLLIPLSLSSASFRLKTNEKEITVNHIPWDNGKKKIRKREKTETRIENETNNWIVYCVHLRKRLFFFF